MLSLVFLFVTFGLPSNAADCPASKPLTGKMITAESVREWLTENAESLKTVEDLVCCLPQSYLKNYLISYAGRAGQNGSPESPRVFMFESVKENSAIITFNGGDAYLNQPHNVELGFITNNKFEIYDIEFYKRYGQMSEKNPTRCLRCHGDSAGIEAKPIFHMNITGNFIGGPVSCSSGEDEIQTKAQTLALENLVKNSRFRCLDRDRAQSAMAEKEKEKRKYFTGTFDETLKRLKTVLAKFQKIRLAQLIKQSPQYERFKFAIVGSETCTDFNLAEWLPPEEIAQLNNTSALLSEAQTKDAFEKWLAQLKTEYDGRARALKKILKSDFELRRGSFRPAYQSWYCPADPTFTKAQTLSIPDPLTIPARFDLDTATRLFPFNEAAASRTARLRLLIEARGIDTSLWTLSLNPKDDFQAFEPVAEQLVSFEEKKGPLKIMRTCDQLKQASLNAFKNQIKAVNH